MNPVSVKRGRRVVILTGIAVGMVLALGLLYWKDFLVRYHVIRLRADPAHLRAAILEPEGSLARAGLSLYLETEEGKDRLARAYFEACESWIPWISRGWGKMAVIFQVEGVLCAGSVEGPGGSGELRDNERDRFIRSSAPFLTRLRGRSFRPEKDPGFQVTFLPADEAGSRTGYYFWVKGGATSMHHGKSGSAPPVGFPDDGLAAMKAATALLIEPVE